jgi:predicted nucleotidyltransferase
MSTVAEIEQAAERLPSEEFSELAAWIDRKREQQNLRDHSAFLNSYAPADEGLYDDALAR